MEQTLYSAGGKMRADDPNLPPEWPRFVVGQLHVLNNYWFRVKAIRDGGELVLEPAGLTAALQKKLARGVAGRAAAAQTQGDAAADLEERRARRKSLLARLARRQANHAERKRQARELALAAAREA